MRRVLIAGTIALALGTGAALSVVYIRAPVSLAFWLTDSYPDFFRKTYAKWGRDVPLPERLLVRAVAYKLSRDWITYEAKRLRAEGAAGESDPASVIRAAVVNLKVSVLNQREVRHKSIDLPTYARLVYGMAWCDGQNNLLAMLLAEFLDGVEHFNLRDVETQKSPHTLVRVNRPDGPLFSDMWSDIPVFALDEINEPWGPGIPTHAELIKIMPPGSPDWTIGDAMERDKYENGRTAIKIRPMPLQVGAYDLRFDRPSEESLPPGDRLWPAYLHARVLHLYGYEEAAVAAYEGVLALGCGEERSERVLCLAAERFIENISAAGGEIASN